jgi:hypothetical protein
MENKLGSEIRNPADAAREHYLAALTAHGRSECTESLKKMNNALRAEGLTIQDLDPEKPPKDIVQTIKAAPEAARIRGHMGAARESFEAMQETYRQAVNVRYHLDQAGKPFEDLFPNASPEEINRMIKAFETRQRAGWLNYARQQLTQMPATDATISDGLKALERGGFSSEALTTMATSSAAFKAELAEAGLVSEDVQERKELRTSGLRNLRNQVAQLEQNPVYTQRSSALLEQANSRPAKGAKTTGVIKLPTTGPAPGD